jgi:N-formylglutamate amidohydrolase
MALTFGFLIGHFIQNHYREATATIHSLQIELNKLCTVLTIMPNTFMQYLIDEKKYLKGLKSPSPTTTLKTQYVQALNDLYQCQ